MNNYERFGWVMFMISGFFFVAIGIRESDWLTLGSAIVWIAGCTSFLLAGRG